MTEITNKTADELYGMIDFGHKVINLDKDDFRRITNEGVPTMYCYAKQDGVNDKEFIESCLTHIRQKSLYTDIKSLLLNIEFQNVDDASLDIMKEISDFIDFINSKYEILIRWGFSIKENESPISMHIIITE